MGIRTVDDTTASDPYEITPDGALRYRMMAWLPDEVLVLKVASFVADRNAFLLSSSRDRICLRLGRKPRWPWLAPRGDLSVDVTLTLLRPLNTQRAMTHVLADIHPLTQREISDEIRRHANEIARSLRACLIV